MQGDPTFGEPDSATASFPADLPDLVKADMGRRWRDGDRVPVEHYLEQFPALRADPERLADLVRAEILLLRREGRAPDPEDYRRRFPSLGEALGSALEPPEALPPAGFQGWVSARPAFAGEGATPSAGPDRTPSPDAGAVTRTLGPRGTPGARDVEFARATVARPAGARASAAAPPGSFADYEILGEIGRGGMGVVYKARHVRLQRLVALKLILAGAHARPEDFVRFLAEAEAVARVQHPNVVQVYEVGHQADQPYIAFEYVEGSSLHRRLRQGPVSPREAATLLETVARAMEVVHQQGIVHRDLKPANILLRSKSEVPSPKSKGNPKPGIADPQAETRNGKPEGGPGVRSPKSEADDGPRLEFPDSASVPSDFGLRISDLDSVDFPKVTDFGLAKRLECGDGLTQTGAVLGTPGYMAPEQAEGRLREISPATDVFALGAILYELLAGRPPFKGDTPLDTLLQARTAEPVAPHRLRPGVPPDLETICLKCLQKEPAQRYASALALGQDLRRFLDGEPILARPAGTWERMLKWARRRPQAAAIVALAVVAALGTAAGVLSYALYRSERHAKVLEAQVARDRVQADVQGLINQAAADTKADNPQQAHERLSRALDRLREADDTPGAAGDVEAPLADLRSRVQGLQAQTAARIRALETYARLNALRNQILFHGAQLPEANFFPDRQAVRAAAREALGLAGVDPFRGDGLGAVDGWTEDERGHVTDGCYEILLVWAGAEATAGTPEQIDTALRLLERAQRLGVPDMRAYHSLRAACLFGRDPGAAREAEARGRTVPPRNALDYFLLGLQEYRRPDLDQAVRRFGQALREKPDDFWARYFRALCHLQAGKAALAQADLTACLRERPQKAVWCRLLSGFAHAQGGAFREAEEDFAKALEANARGGPETGTAKQASYSVYVNRIGLRARQLGVVPPHGALAAVAALAPPLALGQVPTRLYRDRQRNEAVADFHSAAGLVDDPYLAEANLARAYRAYPDFEQAARHYDGAIDAAGRTARQALGPLYRERAGLQRARGRWQEALDDLGAALAASDGDTLQARMTRAECHAQRGLVLYGRGNWEDAAAAFAESLRAQPGFPPALRGRGLALVQDVRLPCDERCDERCKEVCRLLGEYLRKANPDGDVYRARARARLMRKDPEYADAIADLTLALDLVPDGPTYVFRGWTCLAREAPELALDDFKKAVELDPGNGDAYNGRALAFAVLGKHSEAVTDVNTALRLGPHNARLYLNAARTFAAVCRPGAGAAEGRLEDRTRRAYQDRAAGLVSRALGETSAAERPEFWRVNVAGDRRFDVLRRHPRFIELQARYAPSQTDAGRTNAR
jgi:serine/threonine protein kinase/Tfp pilus assembly protein PilF